MVSFNNTTTIINRTEGSSGFNNKSVTNGHDDYGIEQFEESTGLYAFRLVLFSLIILASLLGNSVVCKAVWSISFPEPFSYQLVANMAFAEIMSSLCLPFMLAGRETENSVILRIQCILNPLQVLSRMVVTHSEAAIALYRYRVLVHCIPGGPSRKVKVATICSLWLVPAVICIPTFTGFKIKNGECIHQPVLFNKIHLIIRYVLHFVLPCVVMFASYGAVVWSLRKRMKQKAAKTRKSINPSATAAVEIEEPVELQDVAENEEKEEDSTEDRRKEVLVDLCNRRCSKPEKTDLEEDLLKMIYAIIIIFVVSYFPYQANFLWEYIADINSWQFRYHYLLQNYVFILTCLPNALHPVCYGTINSFYAKVFSKIFLCK